MNDLPSAECVHSLGQGRGLHKSVTRLEALGYC